jgi:hypothetical protein
MRKLFFTIILIGVFLISCASIPVNNSGYSAKSYIIETTNTRTFPYDVPAVPAPSITITKMDFVNMEKDGTIIGSYGTTFESSVLKYLAPRITYDSTDSTGKIALNIKIIKPDGSIAMLPSDGLTTLNVQAAKSGETVILGGWGNDKGGFYTPGTYNCEIWSKGIRLYHTSFIVGPASVGNPIVNSPVTTPPKTETEINFTYYGPQGVNARLYYNGQLIGAIEHGKTLKKAIHNNESNFALKAQIGDETSEFRLAARGSATINVNIAAQRTPSGIIITNFDIVDRTPLYSVRYVAADGLNVRNNTNANADLLDVIPQDCRVEILEEYANGWRKIKYYGNKTGCVNGKYLTANKPSFIVTSLKVGNVNNYGRWLTNAGNALYSSQMRYLRPVITYDAAYNVKRTFLIKIIQPNGTIFRNASISPSGFTYSDDCQVNRGNNQILNLSGWGNNDTSSYQAGEWTVEIWYNNRRLWSEKITIRS